jgi:ribonuclease BN (tRNA processing enzyme)
LIEHSGEKLLYVTDLEYCKYVFAKMGLDHILIECNYQHELVDKDLPNYEHKIKGHLSLTTCKEIIRVNATDKLKTVILCHLSKENSNPEECVAEVIKVVNPGVYVDYARKGLEIELRTDECPF